MKKVLVYGATSAIAQEVCRLFVAEGAKMFLVARNAERLAIVAEDLLARGASGVEKYVADLDLVDEHLKIFEAAKAFLGEIDIVFVAHGVLGDQLVAEKAFSEARKYFHTNYTSVLSILTEVANYFERERRGVIAVISSVAADRGRKNNYIYGAAKAALDVTLSGLRNRLAGNGVTVLTIKPGFVDTPMTSGFKKGPLFASPQKVALSIKQSIDKKRDVVYVPFFWWGIMLIIRNIPERIFKRLSI